MKTRSLLGLAGLAIAAGLVAWGPASPGPASIAPAEAAGSVPDLQDLVGGRATAAETGLLSRGFVSARLRGLTSHWWQGASGRCIRAETAQGLIRSLREVPAAECGM